MRLFPLSLSFSLPFSLSYSPFSFLSFHFIFAAFGAIRSSHVPVVGVFLLHVFRYRMPSYMCFSFGRRKKYAIKTGSSNICIRQRRCRLWYGDGDGDNDGKLSYNALDGWRWVPGKGCGIGWRVECHRMYGKHVVHGRAFGRNVMWAENPIWIFNSTKKKKN